MCHCQFTPKSSLSLSPSSPCPHPHLFAPLPKLVCAITIPVLFPPVTTPRSHHLLCPCSAPYTCPSLQPRPSGLVCCHWHTDSVIHPCTYYVFSTVGLCGIHHGISHSTILPAPVPS